MSSSASSQAPSPAFVFDTLQAYQHSAALRAAIELDLFTAIADGNQSLSAIASRIQASEKGTRVLCDYLTVLGILTKRNGEYGLTPESSAFLNRKSPAYMGSMAAFLTDPKSMIAAFTDLTAVVRKGGAPDTQVALESGHPIWMEFARSMAPMMVQPADLIAKMFAGVAPLKLLDISAGHGMYGIAFARHNPNAKIVGLDWANVLEVAKENAEKAGVADRYSIIAGSAFEVDLGSNYNIVLIPNFLHHFDPADNEKLLKKVHATLASGGMAIAPDFIPNEDRVSPRRDAMFSMQMLGGTPHGDAYPFSELEKMFRNAGFSRSELRELSPFPQRLVVSYK
jgi:ubiquinone/menaquinone biosynthesis C-methylase UbiE